MAALFVVLGVVIWVSTANKGGSSYDGNTKYEAIAQCEARIERLLKSPSTAEFNSSATGSGSWTVTGTVDSENGFGAMVRSAFQCTVVVEGDVATTTVDFLE